MSKISNRSLEKSYLNKGDHQKYLNRIKKTLYYAKFPKTDRLSLPVTELAAELFSEAHKGRTLERLHCDDAAAISRNACISPCSLVLAMLYLERLKICNPEYLEKTAPSDLFLVSLMVSTKFLFDNGLNEDVYMDEWAASGDVTVDELVQLERDFLSAIDWKCYVSELSFWKKLNEIEILVANRESKNRGFCTYTELELLSRTIDLPNLIQTISSIAVILATTYTLGVITILGSIFLASQIPGTSLQLRKAENENTSSIIVLEEANKICSAPGICITELPDLSEILTEDNDSKTDFVRNENRFDNCSEYNHRYTRAIDALNVLKTGILLASIKPCCNFSRDFNETDKLSFGDYETNGDTQYVDWDWWTVPAMNWLSNISETVEDFVLAPMLRYLTYLEISAGSRKTLELEDQIHKATKTRIQDQMEGSWHKEWIDSIRFILFNNKPIYMIVTNLHS